MDAAQHLEVRRPLDQLEQEVVRRHLARPGEVGEHLVDALRYVLSFARLTVVRNRDGEDVEVAEQLAPHRWRVLEALRPHLDARATRVPLADDGLWGAIRELPVLVAATRRARSRLLAAGRLDRDSLEAEVTTRQLVVAAGGGGGSGYGYAGAFTLLHRHGLQPELLAGTSIGSLMSLFRARRRIFDGAPMFAAARRLSWQTVFRVFEAESHYGIPATLRLYLRAAIGSLLRDADGAPLTFRTMEIPLLIVATGITVEGLKHDLGWYERFMDDAAQPGVVLKRSRLARLGRLVRVFQELMETPEALREVVFGADPLTMDADALDAAGFSSAVPGVIHYDIYRDDQHMRRLLDMLYGRYGITRLTEGGIVNNLPARPAFAEVMAGRIGRRNPFVLAMDCFAPSPRSMVWLPLQQVVRPNVRANLSYANLYFPLARRLSPINLVPAFDDIFTAMRWTMDELEPRMPFIKAMVGGFRVLPDASTGA
ncbi:MAG: patatin-like phospholipase family protein [Deltaproteobacteria bacterium]|nr:MAG: patatin-like phospholipase family protein [Deltaproteobacteria bacterium]